jgi:hypothetical protein
VHKLITSLRSVATTVQDFNQFLVSLFAMMLPSHVEKVYQAFERDLCGDQHAHYRIIFGYKLADS